ncbi:MAG: BLUF domain-containing protein [Pseudomonadota bacterium]
MIQLVYISSATESLGSGEVFKIIEKSAKNNKPAGLTGFLIFANGRFFQVIEGCSVEIDALMRKLQSDHRHHSIEILDRSPINHRSFPNWRMKRIAVPEGKPGLEELIPELADASETIRKAASDFLGLELA